MPAPVDWNRLQRPLPDWYADAKLGIFIHWGAYSVPAWAEPTGELGTVDERTWFRHNAYAEWYWNTTRFDDSPARKHHRETYDDAPYDDFLDAWRAEEFDPQDWCVLFARAGARYVVPTTKHHDGIALWDAPGTAARNTVHRGPRRDLVGDLATATRAAGLRFGVYYSGGLDWSVTGRLPMIENSAQVRALRPTDAACRVRVRARARPGRPVPPRRALERHRVARRRQARRRARARRAVPALLRERAGRRRERPLGRHTLGLPHQRVPAQPRRRAGSGLGELPGHRAVVRLQPGGRLPASDERPATVRHLVDVVSRGGNLLLNVGPTASGRIPEGQRETLEALAAWMAVHSGAVHGSRLLDAAVAGPSDEPWVRWTRTGDRAWAIVDASGRLVLPAHADRLELASAALADGTPVTAQADPAGVAVELPSRDAPVAVGLDIR